MEKSKFMANFIIENLAILPLAAIIKKDIENTIGKLTEKGLLIDLSKQFPDYPIMMRQLKLERQILITKGVLKRYIELNESLQQLHMDNTNMRSWEILHSLYYSLVNLPTNEDVKTIIFRIIAVVEDKDDDPDNDKVIELTPEHNPNLDYKVRVLKAVIGLAEDRPIIIMLPGEN
jgi:hypothetical protein